MSDLIEAITGIIHESTQVRDDSGIDLTVEEIYEIENPGRIDFGGGELESVDVEPHPRSGAMTTMTTSGGISTQVPT